MSKNRTIPNYPLDTLQTEIERVIMSIEQSDVQKFAERPMEFVDSSFDEDEVRFLVTARLSLIAAGMIEYAVDTTERGQRTFADKLVSTLVENISHVSDLSKLRQESRQQFVDEIVSLGKHASLKDINELAIYLSKMSGQLKLEENIAVAKFIGDNFVMFPYGNKSASSISFRKLVNELYASEVEFSGEEQQILHNTFKSIIENGNAYDTSKAFKGIGKFLRITPIFFDENLDLILDSLHNHRDDRHEFHRILASFSGRVTQVIRDFSDDLSDEDLKIRMGKVELIFTLLAQDPDPSVRTAIAEEIGIAIGKLSQFDHGLGNIVTILSEDDHPDVQSTIARQIDQGIIQPSGTSAFGR